MTRIHIRKYTYKKDLHDPDNHGDVITHLEADILECKVKWTLGSITMNKASGGDGIPAELFQTVKDDAVKGLLNMSANFENSALATGLEKVSFHSNLKERQYQRMFKLPHNCIHLTCSQSNAQNSPSQASAVHELRTSRCSSWIKNRGTRDQIANICWIIEKAREFQKNIYFCFIDYANAFECIVHNKLWKSLKRWECQTILPAS